MQAPGTRCNCSAGRVQGKKRGPGAAGRQGLVAVHTSASSVPAQAAPWLPGSTGSGLQGHALQPLYNLGSAARGLNLAPGPGVLLTVVWVDTPPHSGLPASGARTIGAITCFHPPCKTHWAHPPRCHGIQAAYASAGSARGSGFPPTATGPLHRTAYAVLSDGTPKVRMRGRPATEHASVGRPGPALRFWLPSPLSPAGA